MSNVHRLKAVREERKELLDQIAALKEEEEKILKERDVFAYLYEAINGVSLEVQTSLSPKSLGVHVSIYSDEGEGKHILLPLSEFERFTEAMIAARQCLSDKGMIL